MYLNVKSNIIFLFLFSGVYFLIFTFSEQQKNFEIQKELEKFSKQLQTSFTSINNENFTEAKSTDSIIQGEEIVLNLITQATEADIDTKKTLRNKLYKHLEPLYNILKTEGVLNLHFVLANQESFLNMNKKDFLQETATLKKTVDSPRFEFYQNSQGVGVTYIFALLNKENKYSGYYEITYPLSFLQDLMLQMDNIKTDIVSPDKIPENKRDKKLFSIHKESLVHSFLALGNIHKLNNFTYLTSKTHSPYIEEILLRSNNKNIISFFILVIIFSLLYWLALNRAKILEEKERFQLAIDSSNDGIWDWNIQKNTTYFSPRFTQMLGYENINIELDFKTLENQIHPEDKRILLAEIRDLLSQKNTILDCEYRILHKNGNWIWVHNRAKAHFDKNLKPLRVVGFLSDVTLRKEYENNQTKLIEDLKNVATVKSNFLANMSHEIRTPMNAIIGFMQILIRNETDEKKLQKFNIINESGKLLLTIINDILDFSKLDTKKLLIEKIPYNISKTFKHLQELFQLSAQEKSLKILLDIDKNLPTSTLGDKIRVEQIVSNLLSNAIKFSLNNNKVLLKLIYLENENQMKCEVSDFGIGISESKLQDIFNPFTQEDSSTTRKFGGTGLGLSISKELCELMNGEIGVDSTLGEGSTFYFTLPLYEVDCKLEEYQNETSQTTENIHGNILIVEDNKTNQLLLTMLLDEYHLPYKIANDGLEALEILKNEKFDLILMDEICQI